MINNFWQNFVFFSHLQSSPSCIIHRSQLRNLIPPTISRDTSQGAGVRLIHFGQAWTGVSSIVCGRVRSKANTLVQWWWHQFLRKIVRSGSPFGSEKFIAKRVSDFILPLPFKKPSGIKKVSARTYTWVFFLCSRSDCPLYGGAFLPWDRKKVSVLTRCPLYSVIFVQSSP